MLFQIEAGNKKAIDFKEVNPVTPEKKAEWNG